MARKTKEEKQCEKECDHAFKKHGQGRQFNVFNLSKITDAGKDAFAKGESVDDAVKAACEKYEE